MRGPVFRAIALLSVLLPLGCGSTPQAAPATSEVRSAAIELVLQTPEREVLRLSDNRGSHVLLALISSFDMGSQAALRTIASYAEAHPDVLVIAVNVAPSAETLTGPFRDTLRLPFAVVYDPTGDLAEGRTALGPIPAVPYLLHIDPSGVVLRHFLGVTRGADLDALMLE